SIRVCTWMAGPSDWARIGSALRRRSSFCARAFDGGRRSRPPHPSRRTVAIVPVRRLERAAATRFAIGRSRNARKSRSFLPRERAKTREGVLDLVIVGAGVSGIAAAMEAKKRGLAFEILEASEPFSTVVNFPKAKPIYTYPTDMKPYGDLQFTAQVKEPLVDEMRAQAAARGVSPRMAR